MSNLRVQPLHESALVKVFDVECRPHCSRCSAEEYASANLLVFPRAGLFVRHEVTTKNEVIADVTHAIFFNKGEPYRVSHPVAGGDDCTALAFHDDALPGIFKRSRPHGPAPAFSKRAVMTSQKGILLLNRLRQHLIRCEVTDTLAVEETCLNLLSQCLDRWEPQARITGRESTQRAHRELANRTRYVLAVNYRHNVGLADIAREVFSSPFHLARIFRREIGCTLHSFTSRLRLREAVGQIIDCRTKDLTRIALDVGFCSHAHMTGAFRSEFGVPPSELRRHVSSRLLREMSKKLEA